VSIYNDPQPLSASTHQGWRVKAPTMAFAQELQAVPISAEEIPIAALSYPIVFAAKDHTPMAVLGVARHNLFVKDGKWEKFSYVPAVLRRYPFLTIAGENSSHGVLGIDAASEAVIKRGDHGEALFEEGKPSAITSEALRLCELLMADGRVTENFAAALKARDLLIDRRADVRFPDGGHLSIDGFQIVDAQRVRQLDDATLVEWHRVGWLPLVYLHQASLKRFEDLVARAVQLQIRDDSGAIS